MRRYVDLTLLATPLYKIQYNIVSLGIQARLYCNRSTCSLKKEDREPLENDPYMECLTYRRFLGIFNPAQEDERRQLYADQGDNRV